MKKKLNALAQPLPKLRKPRPYKPLPIYASSPLRDLINYTTINTELAFKVSGVHRTTWRRWLTGQTKIPAAKLALIKIVANGDLTDPAFKGWRTANGALFDTDGHWYTPGDILVSKRYARLANEYLQLQRTHLIIPKRQEIEVKAAPIENYNNRMITDEN